MNTAQHSLNDQHIVPDIVSDNVHDSLGRVQSLVRAFGLLDELEKLDGMSLSDIANNVRLPRSTVHRLLTTMEALHYVAFDRDTHEWTLGTQAFKVGTACAQSHELNQRSRSIMRSLMKETHHFVNLAVPRCNTMYYLAYISPRRVRPLQLRPGAYLPIHSTASGKSIMAHWSEEKLSRFLDRSFLAKETARTIVDPEALRNNLAVIRQQGYAIEDEEHATGLRCVAAAVLNRNGIPQASLSISDGSSKLDRLGMAKFGPQVAAAAAKLAEEIQISKLT